VVLLRKYTSSSDTLHLRVPNGSLNNFFLTFQGNATIVFTDAVSHRYTVALHAIAGINFIRRYISLPFAGTDIFVSDKSNQFHLMELRTVAHQKIESVSYDRQSATLVGDWGVHCLQDGKWQLFLSQTSNRGIWELSCASNGSVLFSNGNRMISYTFLKNDIRKQKIYFYPDFSVSSTQLVFSKKDSNYTLRVLPFPQNDQYEPLPADMGIMLDRGPKQWRHKNFELYMWNIHPSVLVLAFDTYFTQAQFLKRIAFFREKQNFQGEILSDNQLMGKHGWNAHNYFAEDLALFFTAADENILSEQEKLLRNILVANGVLRIKSGTYVAGRGALLGFSIQAPILLREQLLGHELMHGLYYTSNAYRRYVWQTWEAIDDEVKDFWRFFLSTLGYAADDEALVVNEFQAYLLQKSQAVLRTYYTQYQYKLIRYRPSSETYIKSFYKKRFDDFIAPSSMLWQYINVYMGIQVPDFRMQSCSTN